MKQNYSESDRLYTSYIVGDKTSWHLFAGRVFLVGIQENLPIREILDYIFESYHSLHPNELPKTIEDILKDVCKYKEALKVH